MAVTQEIPKPYSETLLVIEMHFYAFRIHSMHKNLILCPKLCPPSFQITFHHKCLMSAWHNVIVQQCKGKKNTSKPPHRAYPHFCPSIKIKLLSKRCRLLLGANKKWC